MFSYIFIIISVLLIIKPTVNSLFLSELGAEQLPWGYLLVALAATVSSFFYSYVLSKFELNKIIKSTLSLSIVLLVLLGVLLRFNLMNPSLLFFFYVWAAIYAVLSASQFWVLANLVFNVRDAKRLFGFIGSGAILGGIFGGYFTSIFAPILGNEFVVLFAVVVLACCFPLLTKIWKLRVSKMSSFRQKKRTISSTGRPFLLIKNSKHLTYMAVLVALGVLVAKLVDYQFSDFAAKAIQDPDTLTGFFAFWFSSFNLLSLGIQLFFTHRIVGIWGVGFSLLLLPIGILLGGGLFLILPELSAIVVIKAMDGILKQSVNKSATELLALPLPLDLKQKTKSFIDVVVDSIATGIAGLLLIFIIKGLDLGTTYITLLIILVTLIWIWCIAIVRKEYYATFKKNLQDVTVINNSSLSKKGNKVSLINGMKSVFANGTEEQLLFMLKKLMEINDKRFTEDVLNLLEHPSLAVKTEALRNLYFLDNSTMVSSIPSLLHYRDEALTLVVLEYLLLYASKNPEFVFDRYLNDDDELIADTALFCLSKEAIGNIKLKKQYRLREHLSSRLDSTDSVTPILLKTIGLSGEQEFYTVILDAFKSNIKTIREAAIEAAGMSMNPIFINELLLLLSNKDDRRKVLTALHNYGPGILPILVSSINTRALDMEICRFIPEIIKSFGSKESVHYLFQLFDDVDLSIRIEVVRALSNLREEKPLLKFNRHKVASKIFDECSLYHHTLAAMHTQIIVSYRNRKKSGQPVKQDEYDARSSLLELLERRLDASLERIFRLLGLKYDQKDVQAAYLGLISSKEEARNNAIDFLDNLLTGNLKQRLLPIIEEATLDISSDEAIQRIRHKVPTELECFEQLLEIRDLKLNLAVLYLIEKQADAKYGKLLEKLVASDNYKVRTFAEKALKETVKRVIPS